MSIMAYAADEPTPDIGQLLLWLRRQRLMLLAITVSLVVHLLPLVLHGQGGGRRAATGAAAGLQVTLMQPPASQHPSAAATLGALSMAHAQPQRNDINTSARSTPNRAQRKPRPTSSNSEELPAQPSMFAWRDFGSIGMQYYPWSVLDVLAMPDQAPVFYLPNTLNAAHYRIHLQLMINELGGVDRVAIQDMEPPDAPDSDWVRQVVIRGFLGCHFSPAQMDNRPVRSLKEIEWTADATASAATGYTIQMGTPASATN